MHRAPIGEKMAPCLIYAVGTTQPSGYLWRWETIDGTRSSDVSFQYFHDCLEHAAQSGHQVDLQKTIERLKACPVSALPDAGAPRRAS